MSLARAAALSLALLAPAGAVAAPSQLARDVLPDLRQAGVSEACIARLTGHDFAVLKVVGDAPGRSPGAKRREMRFLAERACGETRSFLFDLFR